MASQRIVRVQRLLRAEISSVVQRRIKDPRVGIVTITEVRADPDLKRARVFVSVLGNAEEQTAALAGLSSGAGFIRAELMKVLHLRPMPTLEFLPDDSLARGSRTLDLLDQIRHEPEDDRPRAGAGGPRDPEPEQ
jgi:ribosome-binding factor A